MRILQINEKKNNGIKTKNTRKKKLKIKENNILGNKNYVYLFIFIRICVVYVNRGSLGIEDSSSSSSSLPVSFENLETI